MTYTLLGLARKFPCDYIYDSGHPLAHKLRGRAGHEALLIKVESATGYSNYYT